MTQPSRRRITLCYTVDFRPKYRPVDGSRMHHIRAIQQGYGRQAGDRNDWDGDSEGVLAQALVSLEPSLQRLMR